MPGPCSQHPEDSSRLDLDHCVTGCALSWLPYGFGIFSRGTWQGKTCGWLPTILQLDRTSSSPGLGV